MLLIKILMISVSLNTAVQKEVQDKFFGKDKLRHFSFCFFATNIVYQEAKYDFKLKDRESMLFSISVPLFLSIAKEIKDKRDYGLFSIKDLIWGIGGIVCGLAINNFY